MHHTHTHILTQHSASALTYLKPLFTALLFVSTTLSHAVSANERTAGNLDLVKGSTLLLSSATSKIDAVQLNATMDVSVRGLLAQMTLTQTFHNTSDQWMQARYLFPLPESAAVQALIINTGDRVIHGRIMERHEARETFEAASDSGQITGLVEQQRPNLFTMDVATVAPDSHLSVTLTVMLPVNATPASRSLTLPTTHTPRYTNELTIDPQNVVGAFSNLKQQRGPRLTLNFSIDDIGDYTGVSSDSHVMAIHENGITLNNVSMDRDVMISWPVVDSDKTNSEVYLSEHEQERYAQILLNPPVTQAPQKTARRELVIVVDKSGSMAGESVLAARNAVQFALNNLQPEDHFNIIAFDDNSHPLFPHSRAATDQNLKLARRFTKALDAGGGTEMQESLEIALKSRPDSDNRLLKQIVFLTDGSVGYEETLLLDIKRQLGDSRLFTIGIGSAPNQWFLNKAAEVGRGIALNIPDSQSAANAIERLLSHLANPVITDVSVQFIGGRGEIYPNPIPDLYADKPQMLAARVSPETTAILITGDRQSNGDIQSWQQRLEIGQGQSSSDIVPAVKLFWTRLKVASLLDEQRYAKDAHLHKSAITQLALNAQLLTPYTSFVAVNEQPVRPINTSQQSTEVASLVPHGNQMMNLAMPQGSAGVDTLGWLSAFFAMSGFTLIRLSGHQRRNLKALNVKIP
ncbi:MAG: VIT domain-containing protein [Granulosicoccus sp.]